MNYKKIRKLLGERYHLSTSLSSTGFSWKLYRYYDDMNVYLSVANKEIMSSDTHTFEDLVKFAKTHYRYNENLINSIFDLLCASINMIVILINAVYIKSIKIDCLTMGINVMIILNVLKTSIFIRHNEKVNKTEFNEFAKRLWRKYE